MYPFKWKHVSTAKKSIVQSVQTFLSGILLSIDNIVANWAADTTPARLNDSAYDGSSPFQRGISFA
jgi:hypothetical protein